MKFKAKSEDTRNYVKMKSGESVVGVCMGEPFEFKTHWGDDNRTTVCTGAGCPFCADKKKSAFRFRVNFIVKEDNKYIAKILEMGWNFYEELQMLDKEYHPIENYALKITRQGEKLSTKYSIIPVANGKITPEKEKEISKVVLNDLGHITNAETEPPAIDDAHIESSGDIPF